MQKKFCSAASLFGDLQRITSISLFALLGSQLAFAQDGSEVEGNEAGATSSAAVEEVVVTGVKASLRDALSAKKTANQILDAIASEDIGKLPDTNVAEALQRITGVQINRNDAGDGSGFQVRGLSQNRVELNGRSMTSNGDGERGNSFDAVSSALFKGIEVIKSPTADNTEGALGATVRLKTFQPLDFKKAFTFSGQYQALENTNGDQGLIASSLFAKRWDVFNGEFGALVNFSYENRDATTSAVTLDWGVPTGRPNIFCTGGKSSEIDGVFGPDATLPLNEHPCSALAVGDILATDGSIQSGQAFPVADTSFSTANTTADNLAPLLDYSVIAPRDANFERKPFNNEKSGVDISLQFAPSDNLEFYSQFNYQKFDQLRPQAKVIIPLSKGGNNTRLQDGFTIQEFTREASGDEFFAMDPAAGLVCDNPQESVEGTLYCPVTSDITRGVLVAGAFQENAGRFANNNQNSTETQKIMAGGFKFLGEVWEIAADLNIASTRKFTDELNLALNFTTAPGTYFDFQNDSYDLPVVGYVGNETNYNPVTDTCVTHNTNDDGDFIGARIGNDCGASLLNFTNLKFGGFNGNETWLENNETEFKLDFDRVIDAFGVTTLEFGMRVTEAEFSRRQNQLKQIANFTANPNVNLNVDARFGDLDRNGLASDGTDQFILIEELEPNFVADGVAPIPTFLEDYSRAAITPSAWLTPVFGDQYDYWFDRLTGHAFWLERGGDSYQLEETSYAGYFKANFESDINGLIFFGNAGVRAIRYDYDITSYIPDEQDIVSFQPTAVNGRQSSEFVDIPNFSASTLERKITKFLPSANISFVLSDDMFLRFAASRAVSMPNPIDLAPKTITPDNAAEGIFNLRAGNPDLQPYELDQFDMSYEWYLSDTSALTAALFYKDIKTFIRKVRTIRGARPEDGIGFEERLANGEPLLIRETVPENTSGGSIEGMELSYRSTFDFLPGFASGFGTELNYTFTESSQEEDINDLTGEVVPVQDLSRNSYNAVVFYEKYGLSVRLAYSYRDDSFTGNSTESGDSGGLVGLVPFGDTAYYQDESYSVIIPKYEQSRSQLDLSVNYKVNKYFSVFAQGTNVTNEPIVQYAGIPGLTSKFLDVGATYRLGLRATFK